MGADDPFDALAATVAELLRRAGHPVSLDVVRDVLWEAGAGDLAEDLAVARSVITAADGFHPVATFFVHGSRERELIVRVLGRSPGDGADPPAPPGDR